MDGTMKETGELTNEQLLSLKKESLKSIYQILKISSMNSTFYILDRIY